MNNRESGVSAIIVAICMVFLLGITALAVDIGYLMVTRNELQNIADTAALAAVRQLGVIYEPMTGEEQLAYVCDPEPIMAIARDIAFQNKAAGKNININDEDIIFGTWDAVTHTLTPTLNHPTAVQVGSRRDDNANGPVATFFANFLGINVAPVRALAVASLTAQSTARTGGLPIPVGMSHCWFQDPNFCGKDIYFYPTKESMAGWHTYDDWPSNAEKLKDILNGLTDETFESPEAQAGETEFVFTGGNVGTAFRAMETLFHHYRVKNDGVLDMDEDDNTWTVSVAVYDSDCDTTDNPQNEILIVGFATAVIYEVLGPSDPNAQKIVAKVECGLTSAGRGSGGNYGTLGSIPGLVR